MHTSIESSADAVRHFQGLLWEDDHEQVAALALDHKNAPIRSKIVMTGDCNMVTTQIRILARFALDAEAKGLILAHNHISGNPSPSPDDITATKLIALWLRPIGVTLIDHLILGDARYVSLYDSAVI